MRNVRGKTEDINSRRVVLNYLKRRGDRAVGMNTEVKSSAVLLKKMLRGMSNEMREVVKENV